MNHKNAERNAHGRIIKSSFKPAGWAKNRHIQTIWPRFIQPRKNLNYTTERLDTPDGDFVDLAWSPKPEEVKGTVVIFHGLGGFEAVGGPRGCQDKAASCPGRRIRRPP